MSIVAVLELRPFSSVKIIVMVLQKKKKNLSLFLLLSTNYWNFNVLHQITVYLCLPSQCIYNLFLAIAMNLVHIHRCHQWLTTAVYFKYTRPLMVTLKKGVTPPHSSTLRCVGYQHLCSIPSRPFG